MELLFNGVLAGGGGGVDPDAQAFITAAGITDPTQVGAINTLVGRLKTASLWATKLQAIYPYVGGSAFSHKWNLRDPRDLDAAFRIVWNGSVTHDANGITPDGTTGYGDTKFVPNTSGTVNNSHLSVYSRSSGAAGQQCWEIGSLENSGVQRWGLAVRRTNTLLAEFYGHAVLGKDYLEPANVDARGFFVVSRRASNDMSAYLNGVSKGNAATAQTNTFSSLTGPLFVGATNQLGTGAAQFSGKNLAFASIGLGLTDADVVALNAAVTEYQTTLGRYVGVISPMAWTLNNTTNGNVKVDATGQIGINGAYWWVSSGYSALQTFGTKRKFTFLPTASSTLGLWGINDVTGSPQYDTIDFAWSKKLSENYKVRENGTVKYDSGSTSAVSLDIQVETDGTVKYYRSGSLVYTSASTVSANWYWVAAGGYYVFDTSFTTGDTNYSANLTSSSITVG